MKNTQGIPLIKAYKTEDEKIVLIRNEELNELIEKYDNIKDIPLQIKIKAKQLIPESKHELSSKFCVYKFYEDVEIDNLSALNEIMVRCSDYSIYY